MRTIKQSIFRYLNIAALELEVFLYKKKVFHTSALKIFRFPIQFNRNLIAFQYHESKQTKDRIKHFCFPPLPKTNTCTSLCQIRKSDILTISPAADANGIVFSKIRPFCRFSCGPPCLCGGVIPILTTLVL